MAYGAKGERNGLHAEGKHQHAWWSWDSEWVALTRIAQYNRLDTVTGLLSAIARGSLTVRGSDERDRRRLAEMVKDSYDMYSRKVRPMTDEDRARIDGVS